MGADEKLYELLAGDRDIPWGLAAGHYLMVKVASGGLFPDDAQEVCKIVLAAAEDELREKGQKALEQGTLTGIRGLPAGDIAAIGKARRTRATRIGELLGLAGGTGAGLLATRGGQPVSKAVGAVLGAVGGKTLGKAVGTELDVSRAKARLRGKVKQKAAEIEKKGTVEKTALTPVQKAALIGAGLGAFTGGTGMAALPLLLKKRIDAAGHGLEKAWVSGENLDPRQINALRNYRGNPTGTLVQDELARTTGFGPVGTTVTGALLGAGTGALAGAATQRLIESRKEKALGTERVPLTAVQRATLEAKYGPQIVEELGFKKKAAVERVRRVLQKLAQQPSGDATITSPVVPMPAESPLVGAPEQQLHPEIEAQLSQMQQKNEAEFYRQQAEEAQQQAADGKQRVEELIQQLNMLNQQSQQQMAQDQQIRSMAEQQAQMSSQDATVAREESLQAQQQNMQLRTAVTQFRQALMNLVAQDPTMVAGPPPVQTGPMPPTGAPPEAAPPGAPPGPEAGAPPPGAPPPGAPPEAAAPAPEMKPPAPMAAPPPPAPEPMAPLPPPAGGAAAAPAVA